MPSSPAHDGCHDRIYALEYGDSDSQFGTVNVVRQRIGAMTVAQEPTPPMPGELKRIVEGEV